MYKYKIVRIKHSSWTGKPKESIIEVINNYAEDGWRLVNVTRPSYYGWSYLCTELIFEIPAEDYAKLRRNYKDLGELVRFRSFDSIKSDKF